MTFTTYEPKPFTPESMQEMFEMFSSWGRKPPRILVHPREGFDMLWWDTDWRGPNGMRWADLVSSFMQWEGAVEATVQGYIKEIKDERNAAEKRLKKQLRRKKTGRR